jgi:hypothetical protein
LSTNDYLIIWNHCSQQHKEVKQIPINSKYYLKTVVEPEVEVKSFAENVCEKIKGFWNKFKELTQSEHKLDSS